MNEKSKYNRARNIILVIVALTIINIITVALGLDSIYIFISSITLYSEYASISTGYISGYIIATVALSALIGCWFLSKERILGLILAIVYFAVELLFELWAVDFEIGIIIGELIGHGMIIAYLVYAICVFPKQKSMEDELLGEVTEKINSTCIP